MRPRCTAITWMDMPFLLLGRNNFLYHSLYVHCWTRYLWQTSVNVNFHFNRILAGWIMENGQRIAGAHIISGMELLAPLYRYVFFAGLCSLPSLVPPKAWSISYLWIFIVILVCKFLEDMSVLSFEIPYRISATYCQMKTWCHGTHWFWSVIYSQSTL